MKSNKSSSKELLAELNLLRKNAEEWEQTEAELKRQAAFVAQNPAPVMQMKYDGTIIDANPAARDFFGKRIIGRSVFSIFHGLKKSHLRRVTRIKTHRFEETSGDKVFLFSLSKDIRTKSFYLYSADITEYKRAEEELKNSKWFIEQVAHTAPSFIYVIDIINQRYIYVNEAYENIFGYKRERFLEPDGFSFVMSKIHPDDRKAIIEKQNLTLERMEKQHRLIQQDKIYEFEYRMKDAKDRWHWIKSWGVIFETTKDNKVSQILGVANDISKRKKAEEALRESEEKFRGISDAAVNAIIMMDSEGKVSYWNEAAEGIFGYTEGEIMGETLHEALVSERYYDSFAKGFEKYVSTGKGIAIGKTLELEGVRKNGEEFPIDLSLSAVKLKGKWNAIGIVRDLTEQKSAKEALRESEKRFRDAFENAAVGSALVGTDGRFIRVNHRLCDLLGYSESELSSKTFSDVTHPDDIQIGLDHLKRLLSGEEEQGRFEKRYLHKNGKEVWVIISPSLTRNESGEPVYFVTQIQDITERKQAEEALQASEEKYRAIFEQAADSIVLVDAETGELVEFNDRIYKNLGYTHEEFKDLKIPNLEVIESTDEVAKHIERIISEGSDFFETKHRAKNGEIRNILVSSRAILIHGRDYILSIWRDITERKQTEEEVRTQRAYFEELFRSAPEALAILDNEDRIVRINQEFTQLFGYSIDEIEGKIINDVVVSADYREEAVSLSERVLSGNKVFIDTKRKHKNGTLFDVSVLGAKISRDGGEQIGTYAIYHDITERRKSEEEQQELREKLQRVERIESLNILAGGIAHDLNNILGPITAYPDLILSELPPDTPVRNDILEIQFAAQRAADIIADLLSLAQRSKYEMKPLNINDVVSTFIKSSAYKEVKKTHKKVSVHTDLDKELFNIPGSEPHLSKVFMNIINNGLQSMEDGGNLWIRTYNNYVDKRKSAFEDIPEGEYVIFEVEDEGVGIKRKHIGKIFDPFFTKRAKKTGARGTGLGLSVVHGVVHDHNGFIDIESEKGKGTRISLYFPSTRVELGSTQVTLFTYSGTENILVVDDEKGQIKIAKKLLTSLGYKVKGVIGGRKAVKFLKKKKVDLVLLDMIMEDDFDGLDTYKEIIKIRPGQKALIVSGFSETDRVKEAVKLGAGMYIKKPYTRNVIGSAVREELDKK